jgi:hypothetical protein
VNAKKSRHVARGQESAWSLEGCGVEGRSRALHRRPQAQCPMGSAASTPVEWVTVSSDMDAAKDYKRF